MASSHKNAGGFAPQNSSKYVERKLELKVSTFYCKLNSIEEAKIVRNRYRTEKDYAIFAVAPRRGAWIEMMELDKQCRKHLLSHPAGVRGLKSKRSVQECNIQIVAPRRGAWIEIFVSGINFEGGRRSHPAGVRGLKYPAFIEDEETKLVAPRRGAWIEIATSGK